MRCFIARSAIRFWLDRVLGGTVALCDSPLRGRFLSNHDSHCNRLGAF